MGSIGTDRGNSMKSSSMETRTLILLTERGLEEKKSCLLKIPSQRSLSETLKNLLNSVADILKEINILHKELFLSCSYNEMRDLKD